MKAFNPKQLLLLFSLFIYSCHHEPIIKTPPPPSHPPLVGPFITTIGGNGAESVSVPDGTPATSSPFNGVNGLAIDSIGNLYVSDLSQYVYKITPQGLVYHFAGTGMVGSDGDGGPATAAKVSGFVSLAVSPSGEVYICDESAGCVRKVDKNGIITTIAGISDFSNIGFSGDNGPATAARLGNPSGICFDKAGNLYIADAYNSRVRKVDASGIITTFAGSGGFGTYSGENGAATDAVLQGPFSIAFNNKGELFINDGPAIRKIDTGHIIHTIAGAEVMGDGGDGFSAASALLHAVGDGHHGGIVFDSTGNLYFADAGNMRIRKINTTGIINTIAGIGYKDYPYGAHYQGGYSGDGGSATAAKLNWPTGIIIDFNGNIVFADYNNGRIRKIYN